MISMKSLRVFSHPRVLLEHSLAEYKYKLQRLRNITRLGLNAKLLMIFIRCSNKI